MKKYLPTKSPWKTGALITMAIALGIAVGHAQTGASSSSSSSAISTTSPSSSDDTGGGSSIAPSNQGTLYSGGDNSKEGGAYTQKKFRATVSLSEGYDDNTQTTKTNKNQSGFTDLSSSMFYDLGNERTMFTLGLNAGITDYYSRPGTKFNYLGSLTANISHRVNDRLTLTLSTYATYQVEPQYDLYVEQNRVNGQYFYTADTLSATYQWSRRFSTVTSYQLIGILYQDSSQRTANDYINQTFSEDLRYLVQPTTTAVLSYRLGLVNYLYQTQSNSISNFLLAGFDHSFSPKFTVSLRAGGQIQDQRVGGTSTSPYAEVDLNYSYRRYSSLGFFFNYGFQYSNLAVTQTNKALRTGFQINHGFSPKLSVYLAFYYEHDDFSEITGIAGTAYSEDTFNEVAGIRYIITPKLSLQLNYSRTDLLSGVASNEYSRDVVTLGATYSF